MSAKNQVVDPDTGEPLRRGAVVIDVDGHPWRRGTTRWSCETPVGTRYFSKAKKRYLTVESVGRLPWSSLKSTYGPLSVADLNDR